MVRSRHGAKEIGRTDEDTMKEAVRNVVDGMSIRTAAATFDIKNEEGITFDDSDDEEEQPLEELELPNLDDINVNDFVLVEFRTKKLQVMYTGKIQRICDEDDDDTIFNVIFLRRKTPKTFTFVFPSVDDVS